MRSFKLSADANTGVVVAEVRRGVIRHPQACGYSDHSSWPGHLPAMVAVQRQLTTDGIAGSPCGASMSACHCAIICFLTEPPGSADFFSKRAGIQAASNECNVGCILLAFCMLLPCIIVIHCRCKECHVLSFYFHAITGSCRRHSQATAVQSPLGYPSSA